MPDCLLIDAGNSRLKWTISHDGILSGIESCGYSSDQLPALFSQWQKLSCRPSRVLFASVTDVSLAKPVIAWIEKCWGLSVEIISAKAEQCGVKNCYTQKERLGVDRWLVMIAGRQLVSGVVCVVDCGTATTVDVVDTNGLHLGGLIVPGVDLMSASLIDNTAGIRGDGDTGYSGLLACDTLSAVQGGSLQATVGLVERVQREIRTMIKVPFTTLLCGGAAADLLPLLSSDIRYEPDLVLNGLNIIAMTKA